MEAIVIIVVVTIIYFWYKNTKKKREELEWEIAKEEGTEEAIEIINNYNDNKILNDSLIKLTRGEILLYSIDDVIWGENRKTRTSASYGHLKQRVKIAKGLSYTIGNVKPVVHSENEIQQIDGGILYITNKKLILISNEAKKIDINKIINIKIFSNAIQIMRETGKSVYLTMSKKDIVIVDFILNSL